MTCRAVIRLAPHKSAIAIRFLEGSPALIDETQSRCIDQRWSFIQQVVGEVFLAARQMTLAISVSFKLEGDIVCEEVAV